MLVMSRTVAASRGLIRRFGFATPTPNLHSVLVGLWRTLSKDIVDTYHPERHYMRGPGPKWHAKHGRVPVPAPDGNCNGHCNGHATA
jgi:hypothetical protein